MCCWLLIDKCLVFKYNAKAVLTANNIRKEKGQGLGALQLSGIKSDCSFHVNKCPTSLLINW